MTRTDRLVVGGLVLLIAITAFAIGGPGLTPVPGPSLPPSAPTTSAPEPYREGILGRPTNVSPFGARTQADRDLVALAFRGLVRRDAAARPTADLARSWTSTADGATWTFELDPDARWHDGTPLTAADVAFTIRTLQDPAYRGPGAGSWTGITATADGQHRITMAFATPIAGVLDLATQPVAPEHLLGSTPVADLADDPFGQAPIGSGAYAIVELDRDHAVLEPAAAVAAPAESEAAPSDAPRRPSGDPLATPSPMPRPAASDEPLARILLEFFDDAESLAAAFRSGQLDAASGLDPAAAAELARTSGARVLRYPATTLTAVVANLRPSAPTLRDARLRQSLLRAIDRQRIVNQILGGAAALADGPIPPTSWAYARPTASPGAGTSAAPSAAASIAPSSRPPASGSRAPVRLELLVPTRTADATQFAIGSQVAEDWRALGLVVELVERDPVVIAVDHLRTGDFELALVDIAIGHDPDLYPLLASSQARSGGANVSGLQDPALDRLLEAAREPADEASRIEAFKALQERLRSSTYLLPLAWPDVVTVVSNRVVGPAVRQVSDGSERFGDVLTWRLADDR